MDTGDRQSASDGGDGPSSSWAGTEFDATDAPRFEEVWAALERAVVASREGDLEGCGRELTRPEFAVEGQLDWRVGVFARFVAKDAVTRALGGRVPNRDEALDLASRITADFTQRTGQTEETLRNLLLTDFDLAPPSVAGMAFIVYNLVLIGCLVPSLDVLPHLRQALWRYCVRNADVLGDQMAKLVQERRARQRGGSPSASESS